MLLVRTSKGVAFRVKNSMFRPQAGAAYRRLLETERLPSTDIAGRSEAKRRALLEFAFEHSRYYRETYEAKGVAPSDLGDPVTFRHLPIVTRESVRDRFDDFIVDSGEARNGVISTTGGSTGTPVSVLNDRRAPMDAVWWRVARWWGVEPWDDIGFICRMWRSSFRMMANDMLWWPTRRVFLDASMLTSETMAAFLRRFNAIRPAVLHGYVGAVNEFASFVRRRKLFVHSPKAVWVTSAPLAGPARANIQRAFRAPVYDQYGSCEIAWIACECRKRDGLHVMSDIRHVEIVDDEDRGVPDGEWGRVLVTDLENRVFPLIRYELGDRGRFLPRRCTCGSNLPLLDEVRGRVSDMLRLPGGASVAGEFLTTMFDHEPSAVHAFQVYQAADFRITLRCVIGRHPEGRDIVRRAQEHLQEQVGPDTPVALEFVAEIPHMRGKTQFIISDRK